MIRLNCEITIGNYRFTYVNRVTINKSYDTFTDTATIVMPNKFKDDNINLLDIFSEGDAVEIKLGYYPDLITRFKGYLVKKVPNSPAIFQCEDEAYKLKKQSLDNYSETDITLDDLISANYSGVYEVEDVNLGDWQIQKGSTLINVFEELKKTYGLFSYFKDEILNIKFKTSIENETTNKLDFQYNIIDGSGLRFIDANDIDIVSYGVSKQDNGTLLESFSYYVDGEAKTVYENPGGTLNKISIPNQTQANLDKLTLRRLPNLYYTGTMGSIQIFGKPLFNIGDKAELTDKKFTERNGTFTTKSVTDEFGVDGYRQTVEIDRELT